jgi:hypothetical protein
VVGRCACLLMEITTCGKETQRLIVLKNCFCGRLLGCVSMALDSRSVGCGCRHFSLFKANCTGISLHYDHGANSISSGACSERIRCTCGDRWRAKRVIRSYRLPLTSTARPLDTITVAIGPSGA